MAVYELSAITLLCKIVLWLHPRVKCVGKAQMCKWLFGCLSELQEQHFKIVSERSPQAIRGE